MNHHEGIRDCVPCRLSCGWPVRRAATTIPFLTREIHPLVGDACVPESAVEVSLDLCSVFHVPRRPRQRASRLQEAACQAPQHGQARRTRRDGSATPLFPGLRGVVRTRQPRLRTAPRWLENGIDMSFLFYPPSLPRFPAALRSRPSTQRSIE